MGGLNGMRGASRSPTTSAASDGNTAWMGTNGLSPTPSPPSNLRRAVQKYGSNLGGRPLQQSQPPQEELQYATSGGIALQPTVGANQHQQQSAMYALPVQQQQQQHNQQNPVLSP